MAWLRKKKVSVFEFSHFGMLPVTLNISSIMSRPSDKGHTINFNRH